MKPLIFLSCVIFATLINLSICIGQTAKVNLLEGIGNAEINNLTTDHNGNVISTGFFDQDIDINPDINIDLRNSAGLNDAFIIKTDPLGNFIWGKQYRGPAQVYGNSVSVDMNNNIYVT